MMEPEYCRVCWWPLEFVRKDGHVWWFFCRTCDQAFSWRESH